MFEKQCTKSNATDRLTVHFDLGGYVTHPTRVNAWCGFWSGDIIGPFFFENEQGQVVKVNGDLLQHIERIFGHKN